MSTFPRSFLVPLPLGGSKPSRYHRAVIIKPHVQAMPGHENRFTQRPETRLSASPTLHARLKAATQTAHAVVDAHYSRFDLADARGYRDFLTAHAAIMPRCEAVLDASAVAGLLPDWEARRRTPALLADLAALDCTIAPSASPATPLATPETWGMLYVLEGSRLGGAVLAKRVAANPDANCRAATRYLRHGHGDRLWPTFLLAFDATAATSAQFQRVIDGALETFSLFTRAD